MTAPTAPGAGTAAAALAGTAAAALAELTTLRLGGPARRVVEADTEDDLVAVVRALDADGEPLLVVGGGSNVVVADEGFAGTVVLARTRGVALPSADMCSGASVTVATGEPWDALVARAVAEGWVGVEALSGIPGCTGATPIQNVGAYGQEVSDTVSIVRTYDRHTASLRRFAAPDCGFGYRTSRFKQTPYAPDGVPVAGGTGRYIVLDVTFQLLLGAMSAPIRYAELARTLGVGVGRRAPLAQTREAVLALRRAKGMVLDPADHDTWSAGSFFINPLLDAETAARLPAQAPRFPVAGGLVKTSAAWLIEQAGFGRGYAGVGGRAAVSTKHSLALTNRGRARTADLLALAREIRAGVRDRFGITLEPEPVLVDCAL